MTTYAQKDDYKDFILDQLDRIDGLLCKRMFGGYGLYANTTFFAILSAGRIYFKTDEVTRARYLDYGMGAFQPTPKQTLKHYYEVPVDIVEDARAFCHWASEAIRVATTS